MFLIENILRIGKAVPLQAWTGPEGSRKLRFLDFVTMAQDGGRLSALHSQNYDLEFKTGSTESSRILSFCCLHLSLLVYVVFSVFLCVRLPLSINVFSNITPCQLVNVC